jgi:tetratricopeptide (TPR) repeat protein
MLHSYEQAEGSYRTALTYDPRLASAHAGLGSIAMLRFVRDANQLAMREQALEHWHRSLELDPNQPKIRRLIEKYRTSPVDPNAMLLDQSSVN